jgi:hypothetical protein
MLVESNGQGKLLTEPIHQFENTSTPSVTIERNTILVNSYIIRYRKKRGQIENTFCKFIKTHQELFEHFLAFLTFFSLFDLLLRIFSH